MVMTTFEYLAMLEKQKEDNQINKDIKKNETSFTTWKAPGIITDEWGNQRVDLVEYTGFEREGS